MEKKKQQEIVIIQSISWNSLVFKKHKMCSIYFIGVNDYKRWTKSDFNGDRLLVTMFHCLDHEILWWQGLDILGGNKNYYSFCDRNRLFFFNKMCMKRNKAAILEAVGTEKKKRLNLAFFSYCSVAVINVKLLIFIIA